MIKMVKNGQNRQKWSKSPKMVRMVFNGLKWSKMVQNGPKWFQMVPNGPKWSKGSKMVKKRGKNGQKNMVKVV